jgi:hypothetical protein
MGVFNYKHQSRQFTGCVYQCRSDSQTDGRTDEQTDGLTDKVIEI